MGKPHRKSIIKEALDRLESKMAIGESRQEAKKAVRATGQPAWAFSTGKIHSYKTRTDYQEHTLRFVNWARETYQITSLQELDAHTHQLKVPPPHRRPASRSAEGWGPRATEKC